MNPQSFPEIPPGWQKVLRIEVEKPYFQEIVRKLEVTLHTPATSNIFKALELTPFEDVRVVIVGQDPYTNGEATGLAFAVGDGFPVSGSLKTILKRVEASVGPLKSNRTDLIGWANQGVLLLNSILTAAPGPRQAMSHKDWG
ncbi:MAG: uracil-DNA glycosylase, partial [Proteobacteria bacterium]